MAEGYLESLVARFRSYQIGTFAGREHLFDRPVAHDARPPVFRVEHSEHNVLLQPHLAPTQREAILAALPLDQRHRHFASFRSSQALAQSVFGALQVTGKLDALTGLMAEDGLPAFFAGFQGPELELEHQVTVLNEPRPTSLDVWITGRTHVSVEAKFTEQTFGICSRPTLPAANDDYCSGAYARQQGRSSRCALTERGIRYWEFLPEIFAWDQLRDQHPCPLNATYQLARNVLAACVTTDGLDIRNAHALVVFDARNPSFQPGGLADRQWRQAIAALRFPWLLRRVSWQGLLRHLADDDDLGPLVREVDAKYGLM